MSLNLGFQTDLERVSNDLKGFERSELPAGRGEGAQRDDLSRGLGLRTPASFVKAISKFFEAGLEAWKGSLRGLGSGSRAES